jgi:fatty acid desaturase
MKKSIEEVYPIPSKINTIIVIICSVIYVCTLWLASHISNNWWLLPIALVFAFNMVPVYSLIHEADHSIFHPNKKINYLAGNILCNLFISSFTFLRHCHLSHHKKNRTDSEMWDLYYEHQNKWLRYGNLYLMMIGFGYMMLPVSVIILAIHPAFLYTKLFTGHTEMNGFLEGSNTPLKLNKARIESLVVIAFQVMLFTVLHLKAMPTIILFLSHGFLWSSQNYVNHAFAPRDIINGAHNHKMSGLFRLLYLNFNVHLAHHQNPQVPWIHLPSFIKSSSERTTFLKNYLRLWKGPELTKEPAPH